jgi:hypothetical protein
MCFETTLSNVVVAGSPIIDDTPIGSKLWLKYRNRPQ